MDKSAKLRLGFLYSCFLILFGIVALRLVQLQLLPNEELSELAGKQFTKVGKQAPFRWPIYDRNGEELAVSISSSSVFARPKLIRARRKTAMALADLFGGSPSKWLTKLDLKKSFVWIQRQVDEETATKITNLGMPGIFVEAENRRLYPNGSLAGPLLGFTDIDGNGLGGVEHSQNTELLDSGGRKREARDGRGRLSYIERGDSKVREAGGVTLTLDRRIQHLLEEELERTKAETKAQAALGIIMDPKTGEVLALGQSPAFDPNLAKEFAAEFQSNRNISHLYEPGSTMKPFFVAEAIQSGLMDPNTMVDCEGGKIKIGDHTIHDAEIHRHFGRIPLARVLRVSSNVGAAKVALKLGGDRLSAALAKFGFLAETGIELPGEATSGSKSDSFWTPTHLANVGFGQGVAVTPLQMVSAYSIFANGGLLVHPTILKGKSTPLRQVLSKETAETMKEILLSVVESDEGTGKGARIPGIRVAGKTGTAQKYEANVGYKDKYLSSFIGFLPADNPELVIGVMVDEPQGKYYAADVAVPLFRRVAERSLALLGRSRLAQHKPLAEELTGDNATNGGSVLPRKLAFDGITMPDLAGVSMRESLKLLASFPGEVVVRGAGYLASQSPAPGTLLSPAAVIDLSFSPDG